MNRASDAMTRLARQLLQLEAATEPAKPTGPSPPAGAVGDMTAQAAMRVIAKLRSMLIQLSGPAGFAALVSRALSLAKVDAAGLQSVRVQDDGTLEGFDQVVDGDAAATLIAWLLDLLTVFMGTPVTLTLLADEWPQVRQAPLPEEQRNT